MIRKELLLIAEPDKGFRDDIKNALLCTNIYDIVESVNIEDTLRKIKEFRPEIIIINFEQENKTQLLEYLETHTKGSQIIAYKESLEDISIDTYQHYGISRIIKKELLLEHLDEVLKNSLSS